ncbi:MAG TPA: DUF5996 family protein [Vicinamibacterales bacterium]
MADETLPVPEGDPTWLPLPLGGWQDTYATLHMWAQIAGKICLALTPRTNHWWNITFRVTSRGLTTPTMTLGDGRAMTMVFDFVEHQFLIELSDGRCERIALAPKSVADFYNEVMAALARLHVRVQIWTTPVEVPDPIKFTDDTTHASYDAAAAHTFWRVLVTMAPVFEHFRSSFIGKCSPVHFFWGSFDLAVTRFSGRRAPERPGADLMTREAYSHEVISHGFWPGAGLGEPAFYAYAAPEPEGLKIAKVMPDAAYYSTTLSEFILPYEAVRTAASPSRELMTFLESTYVAAADLARWNRDELERR